MAKTTTRVLAFVLSLVMTISLVACNKPVTPDTTEPSNNPTVPSSDKETEGTEAKEFDPRSITEGVTLKIVVPTDDEVTDWNTNQATLMIEEKFGVDLVFEDYASSGYADKLNVMVQGGDVLPDIIFNPPAGSEVNWSAAGAILELSDFYANPDYAKYTNIAIEKEGTDFVSTMKDAEGKIWGFPRYAPAANDATAYRLWINKEYAKACGFDELPTTTDGFFELCKAFAAAGDLNGNGLDDEVVFSGRDKIDQYWFKFLMTPFVYAWDNEFLNSTNGKLEFAYTTDGWKDGLKYVKQFFDEGLIDTTIITQDKAAYLAIASDPSMRLLAEFYYMPRMQGADNLETKKVLNAYGYVCALEGPRGVAEAYYSDPVAVNAAMITADCKNPEAAFIVLDYLMSQEMSIRNRHGEEGKDWDYWENVDWSKVASGMTKEMFASESGETPEYLPYNDGEYWGKGNPQNAGYMMAGPSIQFTGTSAVLVGDVNSEDELVRESSIYNAAINDAIADMLELKPEERILTLPLTADEAEDVAEIKNLISTYAMSAAANFVTGQWDIDQQWDAYLAELEKMGIADLLATYQAAYDRVK